MMEFDAIVNLFLNSSVSIVFIAYFMFRDYKFIQQLNTNIQHMIDVIVLTNDRIAKIEVSIVQLF